MNNFKITVIWLCTSFFSLQAYAQSIGDYQINGNRQNNIITAVPFLLISPQVRSGAMGNSGVALDADVNSASINVSSMAYLPQKSSGVSLSYTP